MIDVPDHLIPALLEIVNTYVAKGDSYGHAASFEGMYAAQAAHLGVSPHDIADIFEMTKVERLSEIRRQPAPGEPLFEQYRDKAVFAVIALGLFLDSQAGAGTAPASKAATKGVMRTSSSEEHVQTVALGEVLLMLQSIAQQITRVDRKVNALMGTQEDVDAAVQAIQTENAAVADALTQLGTQSQALSDAEAAIQAEVADLQTQIANAGVGASIDTTALNAAVAQLPSGGLSDAVSTLAGAVQQVASLAPSSTPPAT